MAKPILSLSMVVLLVVVVMWVVIVVIMAWVILLPSCQFAKFLGTMEDKENHL